MLGSWHRTAWHAQRDLGDGRSASWMEASVLKRILNLLAVSLSLPVGTGQSRHFWRTVVACVAAMAVHATTRANALDPQAFGSNGPNPFSVAGSYSIDTTAGTGYLSGPGGSAIGFLTPEGVIVFTFESVAIGAGVSIRATGSRPVAILSRTTFIMTAGEINVAGVFVPGVGYQPGAGGGMGASGFQAATGLGAGSSGSNSGGGGGHGTSGGSGGGSGGGAGGIVYGDPAVQLRGGSGGGAGNTGFGSAGGAGGGVIEIGASQSVSVSGGVITVDGSTGYEGGGGGSGGAMLIHGPDISIGGTLRASGGPGASGSTAGGGGGGAGRIVILNSSGSFMPGSSALFALNGGAGGTGGTAPGQSAGSGAVVVGTLGPGPSKVAGCVRLAGYPLAGAVVKFKQRGLQAQTVTDGAGCYNFVEGIAGRAGTLTIEVPAN